MSSAVPACGALARAAAALFATPGCFADVVYVQIALACDLLSCVAQAWWFFVSGVRGIGDEASLFVVEVCRPGMFGGLNGARLAASDLV